MADLNDYEISSPMAVPVECSKEDLAWLSLANEEKEGLLQALIDSSYSISMVDQNKQFGLYFVEAAGQVDKKETEYYPFSIMVGKDRYLITKRFDNFVSLHDDILAEVSCLDGSKNSTNFPQGFHILPVLPDSSITKTHDSIIVRQEELRLYLLKILAHPYLKKLKCVKKFFTTDNQPPRTLTKKIQGQLGEIYSRIWETLDSSIPSSLNKELIQKIKSMQELLNWFQFEYNKFKGLQELNQITSNIVESEGNSDSKEEEQKRESYDQKLGYMVRYIVYFKDIIKRYEAVEKAYHFKKEKFKEWKNIEKKDKANGYNYTQEGSQRALLEKYLKYTSFYLHIEFKEINKNIKTDLAYIMDQINLVICDLKQ